MASKDGGLTRRSSAVLRAKCSVPFAATGQSLGGSTPSKPGRLPGARTPAPLVERFDLSSLSTHLLLRRRVHVALLGDGRGEIRSAKAWLRGSREVRASREIGAPTMQANRLARRRPQVGGVARARVRRAANADARRACSYAEEIAEDESRQRPAPVPAAGAASPWRSTGRRAACVIPRTS